MMQRLDQVDKYLSAPLFKAKVPAVVEFLWSIPGNFFGIPLFALVVSPSLVALFFARLNAVKSSTNLDVAVSMILLGMLFLWTMVLRGNKKAIKICYGPLLGAVAPWFGWALLMLFPSEEDRATGYFQITAWCLSVAPVSVLKPLAARTRPCCSPGFSKQHDKHLTILPRLFQRDSRASFPSGDTAGAMAIVYPLIRCGGSVGIMIGTTCVVLSVLGRMYWKAHHLSDVTAGVLIALSCCSMLEWILQSPCRAEVHHAATAFTFLIAIVILSRWYFRMVIFQSGTISTKEGDSKHH
jgi:membrane-associated phospholipid phosphatase